MTEEKSEEIQLSPKKVARFKQPAINLGNWSNFIPFILLFVVLAVVSFIVPYFLTPSNLVTVLIQTSSLAVMAIGEAAVLILGGIDLSMPGTMALGAIFGAMFMHAGGSPWIAALIMLAVPTFLGLINGFAVSYFNMMPFIVTLAMQAITGGLAILVTNQVSITQLPKAFTGTVMGKVLGIPVPILIIIGVTIIVQLFMTKSIVGRWLYATGTNIRTSLVSGVPTKKVVLMTYAFAGLMAGVAAIILTSRLASASAQMGKDALAMDIIASAAIGGVSTMGGIGTAVNAVVGAIIMTLIGNVMTMANVSYYLTLVVKGAIIIIVVAIDAFRRRR
jgi:ribose/xylose/arabinose/galactoside ABC-type transport system permease subunit